MVAEIKISTKKGKIEYKIQNYIATAFKENDEAFTKLLNNLDLEGWVVDVLSPVTTGDGKFVIYTLVLKRLRNKKKAENKAFTRDINREEFTG